ncbi:MAG: hypothetical protein AB7L94_28430, partial [Kofleriaceae bacterium]
VALARVDSQANTARSRSSALLNRAPTWAPTGSRYEVVVSLPEEADHRATEEAAPSKLQQHREREFMATLRPT